jgi:hypothetical protein
MDVERLARLIYEATRIEAEWSGRIVPETWEQRDEKFRSQFVGIVSKYINAERLPTPEQAHNSWMESYLEMGWRHGEKRDPVAKTHPDLVPFDELPRDEKDKDAIFLAFIWLAREITKL